MIQPDRGLTTHAVGHEFPSAPPGRSGWPWVRVQEGSAAERETRTWPRITVVTPSYNQADYLEETIRSVILQGYPNLEYIIVDGGSTDGSVEIIKKYAPWLSHWCSEKDRGQSHALNKGLKRATGEILGWINSDDIFFPGTLRCVARGLEQADLFLGGMIKVRQEGQEYFEVKRSTPFKNLPIDNRILSNGQGYDFHFYQPSLFWRRWLWEEVGGLDERYHYVMDLEWCIRALSRSPRVSLTEEPLARFLLHQDSKTVTLRERFSAEQFRMYLRLGPQPGFRLVPCLLASMRPLQKMLSKHAQREMEAGHRVRAWSCRKLARTVRFLRTVLGADRRVEASNDPTGAQS